MEKEKRYEEIPMYDQETQYVVECEPVDMGDYIYVGLEVKDMEIDAEVKDMEIDAQERAINDLLISVIPELLGGE